MNHQTVNTIFPGKQRSIIYSTGVTRPMESLFISKDPRLSVSKWMTYCNNKNRYDIKVQTSSE